MDLLLDTNILLFMAYEPDKLKQEVVELLEDTEKTLALVLPVFGKSSLKAV